MKTLPLVSIIIPTKDSERYLERCLMSIRQQTYKKIEIILVDNHSKDTTRWIAKKYTRHIYIKGPERSIQRNYGAKKATGKYLFFVDSDMELSKKVVVSSVRKMMSNEKIKSIIIPEESIGEGFWAACKRLERSFYIGVNFMEASRFFDRAAFLAVKGYDEQLISGEDWYLSQKLGKFGSVARIPERVFHNEGHLTFWGSVKKKYYYAKYFSRYVSLKDNKHLSEQTDVLRRYILFFQSPEKLLKNPLLGIGMIVLKTSEFTFGAFGYLQSMVTSKK